MERHRLRRPARSFDDSSGLRLRYALVIRLLRLTPERPNLTPPALPTRLAQPPRHPRIATSALRTSCLGLRPAPLADGSTARRPPMESTPSFGVQTSSRAHSSSTCPGFGAFHGLGGGCSWQRCAAHSRWAAQRVSICGSSTRGRAVSRDGGALDLAVWASAQQAVRSGACRTVAAPSTGRTMPLTRDWALFRLNLDLAAHHLGLSSCCRARSSLALWAQAVRRRLHVALLWHGDVQRDPPPARATAPRLLACRTVRILLRRGLCETATHFPERTTSSSDPAQVARRGSGATPRRRQGGVGDTGASGVRRRRRRLAWDSRKVGPSSRPAERQQPMRACWAWQRHLDAVVPDSRADKVARKEK
jgi:hypothetical protein